MDRFPDELTVGALLAIQKANPQGPQFLRMHMVRSYSEFVEILYAQLDAIVRALEADANYLQSHTENALNSDICRQLIGRGYGATFDQNSRGHADLTVKWTTYTWIGEGKKVNSVDNSHLSSGYDQLLLRYVSGKAEENQAGLLVYCFARDAKHVMASWSSHLHKLGVTTPGYADNIYPSVEQPDHSFWSECTKHPSSGSRITVKHIGFSLHWQPSEGFAPQSTRVDSA